MAFPELREYHAVDLKEFLFVTVIVIDAGLLAQETHTSKEKKKHRNSFCCFIEEQDSWTGQGSGLRRWLLSCSMRR